MQMLKIGYNAFILVYGLLTLITSFLGLKEGYKTYYIFFLISSLVLLLTLLLKGNAKFIVLILALILLHLSAIYTGLQGEFHLSHHIVRGIISILLLYLTKVLY